MISTAPRGGDAGRPGDATRSRASGTATAPRSTSSWRLLTPLLWRTVREAGLDPVAAEDVVQTVWLRCCAAADSIRDPQTVVKWLLTSARREAWRVADEARTDMARTGGAVRAWTPRSRWPCPAQRDELPDEAVLRDEPPAPALGPRAGAVRRGAAS